MPKLKIRVKLSKLKFKPKNLIARISKAFINHKSQEMNTSSRAKNRRLTMAELLAEEKMQLQQLYYKSISLKEKNLEEKEEGNKVPKQSKKNCRLESPGKQSPSPASNLRISNFFRKRTRFCFSKWKINKTTNNGVNCADENIGIVGDDLARKKEEGSVSDRRNAVGEKVPMQREEGEVEGRKERGKEEEEESGEFELCKRRILMGGKCKPLNVSGTLRYDESGILLPEEIWSKES